MNSNRLLVLVDSCDNLIHRLNSLFKDRVRFTNAVVWVLILLSQFLYYCLMSSHDDVNPIEGMNFSEAKAREYLLGFTGIGSRIVGSAANEELTVRYIWSELDKIKRDFSLNSHGIWADIQTAKGSFDLDFLGGFTNVYENIHNVVVSFRPYSPAKDKTILVNCHYDTFLETQGASDDAVSCATMLAVLHALTKTTFIPNVGMIFLFNGAEESILQGSHAFVTSHPWFKDVSVFVNLEAAGAGGKELLFQITPHSSWLVRAYQDVPHPYASSLAQEVFQSGIVQSDTDFRIFRDFGGIQGMDMAYIRNGYVYHTRHDTEDKIRPGCIQRAGENLMALLMSLSRQIEEGRDSRQSGDLVYLDAMGRELLAYPLGVVLGVNGLACLLLHVKIALSLYSRKQKRARNQHITRLIVAVCFIFCSWIVPLAFSSLVALGMDLTGQRMTWFNHTWLLVGLYVVPSLAWMQVGASKLKDHWSKTGGLSVHQMERLIDDGVMLVVGTALLVVTLARLASSFLLLFFLVSMMSKEVITKLACPDRSGTEEIPMVALILRFCLLSHHHLLTLYYFEGTLFTFIPLMGRAGPSVPSDFVIGILVTFMTNYYFMSHLSTMFHFEIPKVKQVCCTVFGVCLFLATFTSLGFPFSSDPVHPVNQRVFIQHVQRKFNGESHEDSYVALVPLDRTSLTHLREVKGLNVSSFKPLPCFDQPYCGWSYYLPLIFLMDQVYYTPAPPLNILPKVRVHFDEVTRRDNLAFVNFTYTGPEYMSIYLSPCPGNELIAWNIGSGTPSPTKLPGGVHGHQYFVYAAFGIPPVEPTGLNLTIKVKGESKACLLKVAVVGHYMPNKERPSVSPVLDAYLRLMPDWTTVVHSASTYESWTI